MTSHSGIDLKLRRAEHCLDDLNNRIDRYVDPPDDAAWPDVYKTVINKDEQMVRVLCADLNPPAIEWSVILGEFLYNLRSCLDHLAWQLVLANGGKPDDRTAFPIFKTQAAFDRGAPRLMYGMSLPVRAHVENLQPFRLWPQFPVSTSLWVLHELCNIDKHRELNLTEMWCYACVLEPPAIPGLVWKSIPVGLPKRLKPGAVVARYRWDTTPGFAGGHFQMNVKVTSTTDLALPDELFMFEGETKPSGGGRFQPIMKRILEVVRDKVVGTLTPFL